MTAGTTGYTPEFIQKKEEMMTSSFLYDLVNQMYMYAQPDEEAPKDKIYEAESKGCQRTGSKRKLRDRRPLLGLRPARQP